MNPDMTQPTRSSLAIEAAPLSAAASRRGGRAEHAAWLAVPLLISLYYALSLGLHYGVSNQNSYLIRPLHQYDPSLLQADWITTQVAPIHTVFSWVAVLLFHIHSEGGAFPWANVFFVALTALVVFQLLKTLGEKPAALIAFPLLIAIMSLTGTASVSGSYIVRGYFQPSTLGALGFLVALLLFIKRKYALSGIALGLGGLFHANYLILGITVFCLAHVLLGKEQILRRLAFQLAFPLLALVYFLPTMWEMASEGSEYASLREAFLLIRGPHHYSPATFWREFIPFAAWLLIGFGAFRVHGDRFGTSPAFRGVVAFVVACCVLMLGGTILTTVIFRPQVAQIQPWRIAPFVELLCQATCCMVVARQLLVAGERSAPRLSFVLVCAGIAILLAYPRARMIGALAGTGLFLLLIPLTLERLNWTAARRSFQKLQSRLLVPALVVLLVAPAIGRYVVKSVITASDAGYAAQRQEDDLYCWARRHTPQDAMFLTPPRLERFRLHARRAIVVDWKTPPIRGRELVEWFRRLEEVSDVRPVTGIDAVEAGYHRMTPDRLNRLARQFSTDYAVLRCDQCDPDCRSAFPIAFENRRFVVLETE
jgi:hypothetical protein